MGLIQFVRDSIVCFISVFFCGALTIRKRCGPVFFSLCRWVITACIVGGLFSSTANAKSYDEIFREVFGRLPEKQYFSQQMGLVINSRYVGDDIKVSVPSIGSDYRIYSYQLLFHLRESQIPGTVAPILNLIDDEGMIDVEDINEIGYKVVVNRRSFTVEVDIPFEYRKKTIVYVMGEPEDPMVESVFDIVAPSKFSGFMNFGFSTSYLQSTDEDEESGFALPAGSFLGKARTGQYILNNSGAIDLNTEQKINISNLNIVKDYGEQNKQWTFGQVNSISKGSQSSTSLFGVGYTSGPVLDPIGNFSSELTYEVELEKESQVDIYVNYEKVQEFFLEGGLYEFRDFPLRTGFNVVKIVKITGYDVEAPVKEELLEHEGYNSIDDGVVYKSKPLKNESYLEQSERIHQARQRSSEWLTSDKIPRKGQVISDDLPPPQRYEVTEYVFPFSVDPILYDPQYFEWHYAIGQPMSWTGITPSIADNLTHSVYIKNALNRFITTTMYVQANEGQQLIGNESYISLPFGPFITDNAIKMTEGLEEPGYSSKFSFVTYPIYYSPDFPVQLLSLGFSGGLRSADFLAFGVARPIPHDNALADYSASLSFKLKDLFTGSVQYSESVALLGNSELDIQQFAASIQRDLPFGLRMSTSYTNSIGKEVLEPQMVLTKFTWTGIDDMSFSTTYKETVGSMNVKLGVTHQGDYKEGALKSNTLLNLSDTETTFDTGWGFGNQSLSYFYYQDSYQTDHQLGYAGTNQRINSSGSFLARAFPESTLNLFSYSGESSIAFSGTTFAFSNPIQDSFVIFKKDDSLKDDIVFVGDEGNKIDFFGPAVIPTLRDRTVTDIVVDVPTLPIGSELDRLHSFRPVNFTGYLVSLHVTPSVMIMGKLLNDKKRPVKYIRGYVKSESDPSVNERLITSRSGIFQVANLTAGDYYISFGRKPYKDVTISIPSDVKGLYRMDSIQLESKEVEESVQTDDLQSLVQENLEQKKAEEDVDDQPLIKVSDLDLLNQLMDDILAEEALNLQLIEESSDIVDEQFLDAEPPPKVDLLDSIDMHQISSSNRMVSAIQKARYLHQLKMDINKFKQLDAANQVTDKDSLTILSKIHYYFLTMYDAPPKRDSLINDQLRTTIESSILEHRARSKKRFSSKQRIKTNVKAASVSDIDSGSMKSSLDQHEKRSLDSRIPSVNLYDKSMIDSMLKKHQQHSNRLLPEQRVSMDIRRYQEYEPPIQELFSEPSLQQIETLEKELTITTNSTQRALDLHKNQQDANY